MEPKYGSVDGSYVSLTYKFNFLSVPLEMGSLEHNELRTDLTNFNRQFNRLPTTQEYQEDDKLKVQSVLQRHRRKPKRNHARFHRHINITKVLILPKYLNLTHLRSLKTTIHIIKVTHIDQFFVLKSLTKHCLYYITTTLKCFASEVRYLTTELRCFAWKRKHNCGF